jgi:hypothetical protein
MELVTIAEVEDTTLAIALNAALRAYGFHPGEGNERGLPGLPGVIGPRGIAITVPTEEAEDAKILADDLLKEMLAR